MTATLATLLLCVAALGCQGARLPDPASTSWPRLPDLLLRRHKPASSSWPRLPARIFSVTSSCSGGCEDEVNSLALECGRECDDDMDQFTDCMVSILDNSRHLTVLCR